ncbi:MAG: response regulator transcription factor, partial [bacterium]|nr:response regulator transcription factor [bacterium]
ITGRLLGRLAQANDDNRTREPVDPLTDRDEQVVAAVARGRTNAEIAEEVHISLGTVKAHLGNLMTKLAVRNRVEVAMWAYETGRIET